jgi:predicted Rossmann fold flavoprotein
VYAGDHRVCSRDGDILFTHEGISGPAALEASKTAASVSRDAALRLDFFPSKEFSQLDEELNLLIRRQAGRMVGTVLEMLLPNRLVLPLLRSINVDPEKRGHVLTREERRSITRLLKSWKLGSVAGVDIARAEVTAGGVSLEEVVPRTMRSRIHPWLYLCGEVLDIAGPVGGYNLQAAFSTGYVAGDSAGRAWLAKDMAASGNPASGNTVMNDNG